MLLGYTSVLVVVYEVLLRRCRETEREREKGRNGKERNGRAKRAGEPPW